MNRLPICIRTSQDYRTRLFVPALLRAFSRAQDCFRYDWHRAEKFDVAELECLRIDFQLGIRVLRWELKFNIDLRLELCLRTANELICNASSRGIPGPYPTRGEDKNPVRYLRGEAGDGPPLAVCRYTS